MQIEKNKRLVCVILASGLGVRANKRLPKQYFTINNKSLLEINIIKHTEINLVSKIIVVVNFKHKKYYQGLIDKYKNIDFIEGGNTRQKSSYNALKYLRYKKYHYIMIHDAARPFVTNTLIEKLCKYIINKKEAVIPVLKVNDSLKMCKYNKVISNVNRENIYVVQTPQIFYFSRLLKSYDKNIKNLSAFTDDSQIYHTNNNKIFTIAGEEHNIKITTLNQWLEMKKKFENNFVYKVGTGFDVHKLVKGKNITLFGLKIPNNKSLLGNSDADVGVHAIIDAILGALSLGDIGKHFPDNNKKFKNISSLILLKKIYKLIKERKAEITHIDCTLIGEKPKISKYTKKMISIISDILKININDISIKATTTENLGFTGRKEGLACMCNVTIKVLKNNE